MKKFFLAMAVIVIAIASFAFRNGFAEKKSALTSTNWVFTGTDPADMTDPDLYNVSGSTSGCGGSGNAPCLIQVPDDITEGDAEADLAAYLVQFENDHPGLLDAAISKKPL